MASTRRLAMVRRVAQERTLLLSPGEACQLLACLKATDRVGGDVAELGVAYGASAKLLSMCLPPGKSLALRRIRFFRFRTKCSR